MKSPVRLRLTGLLFAIALGIGLLAWTEQHAWREAGQLQNRFEGMREGGFHLADHLEATVRRMNDMLQEFDLRENPGARASFIKESEKLQVWLKEQLNRVSVEPERGLLVEVGAAFDDYITNSVRILNASEEHPGPGSPAMVFEQTEKTSERLFHLGRKLAEAQRASLDGELIEAKDSLGALKILLAGSLGLLIVLSLVIAVVVYRGMIAPLRVKLVEARAVAERQEKLASLGALAAGVAHEIRNPLTAIKARLFTQQKLLADNSEPLEDSRFISEEISRLDDIIKNFLVFARPAEPRFERVRATAPLRELTRLLEPELKKRAISLKHEFLADPEIRIDPQQMKQVLINLIRNAADSVAENGLITLRTRTKPAWTGARSPHLAVLEVEDNGQGIAPEVQKRLFDPFFTTKESGTGLGLSIAVRILEKHGGALEYQTQVGRGSVFSVIMPIAQHHDREHR